MNNRRVAIAGLLVLAAGVVSATLWYANRDVPVELLHPEVPAARWAAYRAEVRPPEPRPEDAALLQVFVAVNRAEVAAQRAQGDVGEPLAARDRARAEWSRAASEYAQLLGPDRFLALGRAQGLAFGDALAAFLAHARASGRTAEDALLATPEGAPPAVRAYIDLGGLFVLFADRSGFVEDGALVEARRPLLQAVFLDAWARAAHATPGALTGHLRGDELEWLNRWRAEWQIAGQTTRRVEAALALQAVPDYPARLNAGVLLYHAGQLAEAVEHFAAAPEPVAVNYRRMAEKARR